MLSEMEKKLILDNSNYKATTLVDTILSIRKRLKVPGKVDRKNLIVSVRRVLNSIEKEEKDTSKLPTYRAKRGSIHTPNKDEYNDALKEMMILLEDEQSSPFWKETLDDFQKR